MFSLPISAKIKAVVALIAALVVVATGVIADEVFDIDDATQYGIQAVEAILAYIATYQAPRNRVVLTPGERIRDEL